ncbi:type VI secretion system lipoprotein TssJ [Enterobacter sp. PTB]|uniref:type VI secretion system lipoprotein TssJ n=1 Tax=Enterobacter sp. PTB TaxID=3143437 RepID=UPI003DA8FB13
MAITGSKVITVCAALAATVSLSGCGLTQKVSEGTKAVTTAIFYKQVRTLHLDLRARAALNVNDDGIPLPTMIRIYQLKDRKAFDGADYKALSTGDGLVIKADLLAEKDIRLKPGEAVAVDMPAEEATQYVAVAAMFLSPDQARNTWRLVIPRQDLDPDKARRIEASDNRLTLLPLKDKK